MLPALGVCLVAGMVAECEQRHAGVTAATRTVLAHTSIIHLRLLSLPLFCPPTTCALTWGQLLPIPCLLKATEG
jgi:hypothetical protein